MKKFSKKTKMRVTLLIIVCCLSFIFFVSSIYSYTSQIKKNNNDIEKLESQYKEKLSTEEELKDEISKLEDPEYMAKYAREKYLYSKKDEIILKIDD